MSAQQPMTPMGGQPTPNTTPYGLTPSTPMYQPTPMQQPNPMTAGQPPAPGGKGGAPGQPSQASQPPAPGGKGGAPSSPGALPMQGGAPNTPQYSGMLINPGTSREDMPQGYLAQPGDSARFGSQPTQRQRDPFDRQAAIDQARARSLASTMGEGYLAQAGDSRRFAPSLSSAEDYMAAPQAGTFQAPQPMRRGGQVHRGLGAIVPRRR